MKENFKILVGVSVLLLTSVIIIPLTTNALSGSNVNSGAINNSGSITGSGNLIIGENENNGNINNYDRIDFTEDGIVDISDQIRFHDKCQASILGKVSLGKSEIKKCDMNEDGTIDIYDVTGFYNEFNDKVVGIDEDTENYSTGNQIEYSEEFLKVYKWAYDNGIIGESNIDDATLYNTLPNPSLEAILLKFATYIGQDSNLVKKSFGDLFIDEGSTANRASFGTALSRILWGNKYDGGNPFYKNHLRALKSAGIMDQIDNPEERKEIKGYVLTMLMNASEIYSQDTSCDNPTVKNACNKNLSACPKECKTNNSENYGTGVVGTGTIGSGNYNSGYVGTGILTNNLTKAVEYKANEVSRNVLFNGIYKAINDTSIYGISVENNDGKDYTDCYNDIILYTYIDGEEVDSNYGNMAINSCGGTHYIRLNKQLNIKKGNSVKIRIEGELNSASFNHSDKEAKYTAKLRFHGEKGKDNILASANLLPVKIVEQDAFIIQSQVSEKKVYLKGSNKTIAEFYIKPSKGNNKHLDKLVVKIDQARIKDDNITLKIDGKEYDFTSSNDGDMYITSQPDIEISSQGVPVQIILKHEPEYEDYTIGTELKSINGKSINKTFSKRFVSILAYISKQENKGSYTEFTIGVDKYDDNYSVSSICMLTGSTGAGTCLLREKYANGPFEDGYTFSINNSNVTQPINYITYFMNNSERDGWADSIRIEKKDYPDYFNVNGTERKIYSNGGENSNTDKAQNSYSEEMLDAYQFAYEKGITTANTIEKARMYSPLTRIAMAKMLSQYAINVLGKEPDVSKGTIKFKDITDKQNVDYNNAVNLVYQLGIMGQNIKSGKFRPNDKVTSAEFVTALSRMLYGTKDGKPYYVNHFEKLKEEGIINNTGNPQAVLLRGYAMLMLMRSAQ